MLFNIWVDCDEVLAETIDELLKRSPLVDRWIKKTDILSYYLSDVEKIGLTPKDTVDIFCSFFSSPEYYQTQPVLWAYEKLYKWKQQWHRMFLVTARAKPYEQQTRNWVETHFPNIFSWYLFMNQYTDNEVPKSVLCKEKWIQLLIDDNVQNIQDVNSLWLPGFLLDKPWNQNVENTKLMHRVYSWDEIELDMFN